MNSLSILGFNNEKWIHCRNPEKMGSLKNHWSDLFNNKDNYVEYLKKTNRVCLAGFAQFVPVNVMSFKDVFFPLSVRKGFANILVDLITLVFRLVLWIPRAIYKLKLIPPIKLSHPLEDTRTTGFYNDLPVLVTIKNKESFYFSNTSMHEFDVRDYFEKAKKKNANHVELQFSSDNDKTFLEDIQAPVKLCFSNEIIHYPDQARAFKLSQFIEMNEVDRQKIIDKFELQGAIGDPKEFFDKLQRADRRLLEILNLENLIKDRGEYGVKYALMSDKEFESLTLEKTGQPFKIASKILRLRCSYATSKVGNMNLINFYHLSSEEANKFIDKPWTIQYMSDENVKKLNPNITKKQFEKILRWQCNWQDHERNRENFAMFSSAFVATNIEYLTPYQFGLISDEQFKDFDFSKLSKKQIQKLLKSHKSALLSPEQLKIVNQKLEANG